MQSAGSRRNYAGSFGSAGEGTICKAQVLPTRNLSQTVPKTVVCMLRLEGNYRLRNFRKQNGNKLENDLEIEAEHESTKILSRSGRQYSTL